jgi:hypothetical protein
MTEILYYGRGEDSQRVINAVEGVVDANAAYRFVPPSRRDEGRAAWGVRVPDSADETAVTDALESEFGQLERANTE